VIDIPDCTTIQFKKKSYLSIIAVAQGVVYKMNTSLEILSTTFLIQNSVHGYCRSYTEQPLLASWFNDQVGITDVTTGFMKSVANLPDKPKQIMCSTVISNEKSLHNYLYEPKPKEDPNKPKKDPNAFFVLMFHNKIQVLWSDEENTYPFLLSEQMEPLVGMSIPSKFNWTSEVTFRIWSKSNAYDCKVVKTETGPPKLQIELIQNFRADCVACDLEGDVFWSKDNIIYKYDIHYHELQTIQTI